MAWSSPRTWVTSEVVTAAHMNQEVRDNLNAALPDEVQTAAWSSDLEGTTTDPTGNWTGYQYQVGGIMHLWGRFAFTGPGEGVWFVTIPTAVNLTASTALGTGWCIGSWQGRDDTGPISAGGSVLLASTTTVRFELGYYSSGQRSVDEDTPWTWSNGDILTFHCSYPVA